MIKFADFFCGIGGFTQAGKMAGMTPVAAVNHWPLACEYHDKNHPEVKSKCQDLRQIDWGTIPDFDIMVASPACQGHSKAKGKEQPRHDALRMTAWAVIDCMEYHQPQAGVVENVVEFMDWSLYPSWVGALNRLGYQAAPHIVNASDHGVPQDRERVFIAITKSKAPIKLKLPRREPRTANDVIRWDKFKWTPVTPTSHVPATLARIASGRARFGDRFVAPFYGSGSGETGRSVHRPIGTVTTKDRWLVVNGDKVRVLQPEENLEFMGFDPNTILPPAKYRATEMMGNGVCPLPASDILKALVAQA